MADLNTEALSESEEMYLLTIEKLGHSFEGELVPLGEIAEALGIKPVSVNQMVRKLEEAGLVEYQPYKGVKLAESGRGHTQLVLRDRRIWKTFLNQKLGVPISKADELACRFEHITPEEVIVKLYTYLGEPSHTPEGEPIPEIKTPKRHKPRLPLTHIATGEKVEVHSINLKGAGSEFLAGEGILAGAIVKVLATSANGTVLIEGVEGQVNLVEEIASEIMATYLLRKGGQRAHA